MTQGGFDTSAAAKKKVGKNGRNFYEGEEKVKLAGKHEREESPSSTTEKKILMCLLLRCARKRTLAGGRSDRCSISTLGCKDSGKKRSNIIETQQGKNSTR